MKTLGMHSGRMMKRGDESASFNGRVGRTYSVWGEGGKDDGCLDSFYLRLCWPFSLRGVASKALLV